MSEKDSTSAGSKVRPTYPVRRAGARLLAGSLAITAGVYCQLPTNDYRVELASAGYGTVGDLPLAPSTTNGQSSSSNGQSSSSSGQSSSSSGQSSSSTGQSTGQSSSSSG